METDLSTLKLVIEKGPREGEALEFTSKPGLTIRIGRVVRGNTFAIKDNGISSKHLSIEWLDLGKWVIRDLDSSNGTFLNSLQLRPFTDHDLRDGDELKIGEVTSIRVWISLGSDLELRGINPRRGARGLATESVDDGERVAEEGNRGGRGRGRGRGRSRAKGNISSGNEGLRMEDLESVDCVDLDLDMEGKAPGEGNQRGRGHARGRRCGNGDEGPGLTVSASVAPVNVEVNMETDLPEKGVRRGRGRSKLATEVKSEISETVEVSASVAPLNGEVNMDSDLPEKGVRRGRGRTKLVTEVKTEISENVEGIGQKGEQVCKRRTRSSKNVEDEADVVGEEGLEKGVEVESKAKPAISLRRSTRRTKNKDNIALAPVLESVPEASLLADAVSCEGLENFPLVKKGNTRTRQGRRKNEAVGLQLESAQNVAVEHTGREEKLDEGAKLSGESTHDMQKDDHLASGSISGHGSCKGLEFVVVKSEPQSNVRAIVSRGEQSHEKSTSEVVQKDGNSAGELNLGEESREGLEFSLNPDDKREPGCNIGGNASQESTAVGDAAEIDAEANSALDLEKMTLREWFGNLEKYLPKQIHSETDQIIGDMLKRSQQFHEFMLQLQKEKGNLPVD